ncbi:ATP-binding protein [Desulfobacterales bacterium HSG2]|nr:ATP-binding protein [Desulfobacterales bacterium HSG2]
MALLRWKKKEKRKKKFEDETPLIEPDEVIDRLTTMVSVPLAVNAQLEKLANIRKLAGKQKESACIDIYLEIEKYMVEEEPLQKYSVKKLRKELADHFRDRVLPPMFDLLFAEEWLQNMRLCEKLADLLCDQLATFIGLKSLEMMFRTRMEGVVFEFKAYKIEWGAAEDEIARLSSDKRQERIAYFFNRFISILFKRLSDMAGPKEATDRAERIFRAIETEFGFLHAFPNLFNILPEGVLEEEKLKLLSKQELESKVKAKTSELSEANQSLKQEIENHKLAKDQLNQTIERLKVTQNQLIQSAKLASVGELAAGVAHELNQPLMIIRTGAQIQLRRMRKNTLDIDKVRDTLLSVEKNTKRMMNIINHLRTFSRQSAAEFAVVDINKVIRDSFLMIGEQLRLRNIEVKENLSSGLPAIRGDANQLEQVVLNLLTNARDAVESKAESIGETDDEYHGEIVIVTGVSEDSEDMLEILIEDNGSGIPQDKRDQIFDPFFTTKAVGKGTGLGLSITYGIIADHEGEISIAETGSGGTTFRILLPVAE